jgi:hypothetical protein
VRRYQEAVDEVQRRGAAEVKKVKRAVQLVAMNASRSKEVR